MVEKIELNWRSYALIAHLADRLQGQSPWFGKTALQKIVYLLQEVYGIDLGYRFSLYTYGPFSKELASDLDFLHAIEGVSIDYDEEVGGYRISPSDANVKIQTKAHEFLEENEDALGTVSREFGPLAAKELELLATIIYVDVDAEDKEEEIDFDSLVETVQSIKPHFSKQRIERAVASLSEDDFVLTNVPDEAVEE